MKLRNFRLDDERWAAFQEKCRENGTTASAKLVQFVDRYLGDNSVDQTEPQLGEVIKLGEIIKRLEALESWVGMSKPFPKYIEDETDCIDDCKDNIDPASLIPIEELQLSVGAYTPLKRAQINTIGDLLEYKREDLKEIKNFGKVREKELVEALKEKFGIDLPVTPHK